MNSSISTSDAAWRRTLRRYGFACAGLAAVLAVLVVGLDPYDTGRLTPLGGYGVPEFGQRLAEASVAREADAQGAIVGNSTIQLIDPEELSKALGMRFVSLAVPGSGPLEQLVIARWFLNQHPNGTPQAARALVFGIEWSWCRADGELGLTNPFPFWLYGDSTIDYIAHLLRLDGVGAAWRKARLIFGWMPPLRRDGYRPYDIGQDWDAATARQYFATGAAAGPLHPEDSVFLGVSRLQAFLDGLPGEVAVVLVFPPRHRSSLPRPGSTGAAVEALCKTAFRRVAENRARTAVIDFAVDGEIAEKDENFFDQIHYRLPIAHLVEAEIAGTLRRITAPGLSDRLR